MHRTKEQWLALFAEQAQSGLTQTEFAKRQGIIPGQDHEHLTRTLT